MCTVIGTETQRERDLKNLKIFHYKMKASRILSEYDIEITGPDRHTDRRRDRLHY